jgi:ABC-2 type transport system permease protein
MAMVQKRKTAILQATARIAVREWRRLFGRRESVLFALVLPVILCILFGAMYWRGVVYDIPLVICDQDHSELSRLLTRSLESTRSLRIKAYVHSPQEIRDGFQKGEWQAAVVLPADLEAQVKEARPASVVIYRNQANIIIGNLVYKDVLTVVKTVSAGVLLKKMRAAGMTEERALNVANPIRVDVRSLYNPYYNYAHYLLPGLLTAMLQMSLMMTAALVISAEFKENSIRELAAEAKGRPWAVLFGKALPYVAVGILHAVLLFFVLLPLVKMAAPSSWLPTLGFTFLFVLTCSSLGLMISCLVHDQLTATEIAVFINTPAFLFSGYTFPIWGMPALHSAIARIMPFTYYLSGLMKVYLMNEPPHAIWREALALLAFLLLSGWISIRSLAKMVRG